MIVVLSSLFVQAGVTPPVNDIEEICRCPGENSTTLSKYVDVRAKSQMPLICVLNSHVCVLKSQGS